MLLLWILLVQCISQSRGNEEAVSTRNRLHNVVSQKLLEAPTTAAGALRLFFHDCFVEGCDASVLIASSSTNKAERDAEINLSLPGDGFDVFFRAKRALELQCPGIVSCADVMAIATRDLVNLVGGPRWEVHKGRRDGLYSKASSVGNNLPQMNQTITQLINLFESKGLTVLDMVALSGAHTIGLSHCKEYMSRIYSYNKTFDIDPSMNKDYAQTLRRPCPNNHNLDPNVTDQKLFTDSFTRRYVLSMAKDEQFFFSNFVAAMIKLASIGVKVGTDGEVRRDCGFVNP
ncbi:hypothetical protein MKX01_022135 [Papaver californicum]|nr:hypothetical protein MKX01_022135 [Papaver californicum]